VKVGDLVPSLMRAIDSRGGRISAVQRMRESAVEGLTDAPGRRRSSCWRRLHVW
jgi:hypothetical protein